MSYHTDDTICAIATAAGGAARGMVRISGPDAVAVVSRLFSPGAGPPLADVGRPTAVAGHVRLELESPQPLAKVTGTAAIEDREPRHAPCLLFLWPTLRSYTRQPVAELHTIGSAPLLQALASSICRQGARLAEPGEFTLRAFLAGRLDLTQAEGVLGVIDAGGDDELRGALAQLAGGIARPLRQLRETLLQLLAELEAGLDFVDEDIEFVSSADAQHRLRDAQQKLREVAQQMATRQTAAEAPQIALTGASNAGKSSLFNALVARRGNAGNAQRSPRTPALVSNVPGTTRDYLTATIDLDGLPCELIDTAGLDSQIPQNPTSSFPLRSPQIAQIDSAAQLLAFERGERAMARVRCVDSTDGSPSRAVSSPECELFVLTKSDLVPPSSQAGPKTIDGRPLVWTSSHSGAGIDELCTALRKLLTTDRAAQPGQVAARTAERCRESIRRADAALGRAAGVLLAGGGDELVAAELRSVLSELGKVVGAVYTDDVLDRIFSTFCIGK